jgi:hypothetical protein
MRRYRRLPVLVDCRVEGIAGDTRLTDLTPVGCYIDTTVAFPAGSTVTLKATLGEGEVPLSGRVIPMRQSGFGFGLEFVELESDAQQMLETYYQQHAAN